MTIAPSARAAYVYEATDAVLFRRRDHSFCAARVNVHVGVALRRRFDRMIRELHGVNDCIHALRRAFKRRRVAHVAGNHLDPLAERILSARRVACHAKDFVVRPLQKLLDNV